MRTLQILLASVVLLATFVWFGKSVVMVPRPVSEMTAMAKCVTSGGKPLRAGFVYVCVPKGLNVESDHAHHVTSHTVSSESGATLKIITTAYGAREYGLPIEGGKQDRIDIRCVDFPGTDIRAVQSDGKRARSMTSFPVSIYYDWTDAREANLFDEIFSFGCHSDAAIGLLAP